MSRKSENSRAGSAGDGESVISSYDTSPRKTPELATTGPFGDYSTERNVTSNTLYSDSISSTDSDDQESNELKTAYMEQLKLIREKLASIDIANKHYYSNCFQYPPHQSNHCIITEILDDDDTNINGNEAEIKSECKNSCRNEEQIKETQSHEEVDKNKNLTTKEYSNLNRFTSKESLVSIDEDKDGNSPENIHKKFDFKMDTIFKYDESFNNESSSIELFDLNYNPPKKKPCIRETTPKMIISESAIPLPHYIGDNLHRNILSCNKKSAKTENNLKEHTRTKESQEDKEIEGESHIFPKVQVEYADNTEPNTNRTENEPNSLKQQKSDSNIYVLFLDPMEQSPSASTKSYKTIITDTTSTSESPHHKPKKRRILMRSANNKVNPITDISLWEEIRTMDAINKSKRARSSSAKETRFQDILLKKEEPQPELDVGSIGSLDVPPKGGLIGKFPSITKITRMCSSLFSRKSDTVTAKKSEQKVISNENIHKNSQQEEEIPKLANILLSQRKDQALNLGDSQYTPSSEEFSDYSEPDDDIDAYYEPFCLFCYCF